MLICDTALLYIFTSIISGMIMIFVETPDNRIVFMYGSSFLLASVLGILTQEWRAFYLVFIFASIAHCSFFITVILARIVKRRMTK